MSLLSHVPEPERVAIVGSRGYSQLERVREYVRALPLYTVVISGGARGVDQAAADAAYARGMSVEIELPDYDKHGRRAPLVRNAYIVQRCTRLVAFWDGKSTGTMHAVRLATKAGKAVERWTEGRDFPTRTVNIKHCTCGGPFGCDVHEGIGAVTPEGEP